MALLPMCSGCNLPKKRANRNQLNYQEEGREAWCTECVMSHTKDARRQSAVWQTIWTNEKQALGVANEGGNKLDE